ncbi:MAG: Maf family protein [Dehalococcoidia bacterium]|nr:Maf family protein [Dehalococcoidia bacterium]
MFGHVYPVQTACNAVVEVARAWGDLVRWPEPRDAAFYGIQSIVLASGSPRRRELLAALSVPFEVDVSDVDEITEEPDPVRVATLLAERKSRAVAARRPGDLVIGSDTVVAVDGRMLGKPADAGEARAMLTTLRGRTHQVVTGGALVRAGYVSDAHAATDVTMRPYSDAEIEAFIATGSPFDKAGGYAIQDPAFAPVARFEGCECAVIGLPLWTLRGLLTAAGVETSPPAIERCATCPARATAR